MRIIYIGVCEIWIRESAVVPRRAAMTKESECRTELYITPLKSLRSTTVLPVVSNINAQGMLVGPFYVKRTRCIDVPILEQQP